jgi:hypothetical protein
MIEQITCALVSESGAVVAIKERQIDMKIEAAIADTFSEICRRNNAIEDSEIKTAEKFHFAATLQNYLKEMKENDDRTGN